MVKSVMIYLIYLFVFILPFLSEGFLSGRAGDLILFSVFLLYSAGILLESGMRKRFINGIKNFYKDKLDLFMGLLLVIMGLSFFYSYDKSIAVSETIRYITYIVLYFIIKYEIVDEKIKENILKIYIFINFVLSVMGIIQYFTKIGLSKEFIYLNKSGFDNRITVTLSNPNTYGAYLILAVFPVLLLALKEKKLKNKIFYSSVFLLILVNIFFTYSRNAWLGFALGCFLLIIIFSWKLVVIFGGVGIAGLFVPRLFNRLRQIFDASQNQSRINLWKIAGYMIKDHPILGVGNGNYASLYNTYASRYPKLRFHDYKSYPCHNSYIKIQTELGIMGTLCFAGILASAWIHVKIMIGKCRNSFIKTFYIGFSASMAAFYFMNIFDNLFFVPKATTYFWVLLAVSESFLLNNTGQETDLNGNKASNR